MVRKDSVHKTIQKQLSFSRQTISANIRVHDGTKRLDKLGAQNLENDFYTFISGETEQDAGEKKEEEEEEEIVRQC